MKNFNSVKFKMKSGFLVEKHFFDKGMLYQAERCWNGTSCIKFKQKTFFKELIH